MFELAREFERLAGPRDTSRPDWRRAGSRYGLVSSARRCGGRAWMRAAWRVDLERGRLECSHYNGRLPLAGGLRACPPRPRPSHSPADRSARIAPEAARGEAAHGRAPLDLQQRSRHRTHAAHGVCSRARCAASSASHDRFLGYAYVNPHALICARIVGRDPALPARQVADRAPAAGCARAAQAAVRTGRSIGSCTANPTACRASCSTASATWSSGQIGTAGMEALKADVVAAVEKVLAPRAFIWKNDSGARELEGLPSYVETASGDGRRTRPSSRKTACAFSCRWARARRRAGSTTRPPTVARCSSTCRARACSTCSATSAAGVSRRRRRVRREVLCVDSSAPALELLQRSADGQRARQVRTERDDAFDALAALREAGEKFDVVMIDPPAFIKRRKDIPKGQAAYRKLNQLAMQVLARDGILVSCSCSHHLAQDDLVARDPAVGAAPRPLRADHRGRRAGARPPDPPGDPRDALPEVAVLPRRARLSGPRPCRTTRRSSCGPSSTRSCVERTRPTLTAALRCGLARIARIRGRHRGYPDPVGQLSGSTGKIRGRCSSTPTPIPSRSRSGRCTCAGTASCTWSASSRAGASRGAARRDRARRGRRRTSTTSSSTAPWASSLGGRLGWMLFYGTERILAEPLSVFRIWEGGMSFHGGLHRRGHRAGVVRAQPRPARGRRVRFHGAAARDRHRRGSHRQLHQRRTLGQADRRAVGRRRRRRAAASVAALRGGPRRPRAVRDPLVVHVEAAVPLGAVRACSWSATACSVSRSSSCACRTRTAATCCSTGSRWASCCRCR